MIKDHTVKLGASCQSGTGWFLDFELPKNSNSYPTKWFIATNLHVINMFRFKDNPYEVSLPISQESLSKGLINNPNVGEWCKTAISKNLSRLTLYTQKDMKENDDNWYWHFMSETLQNRYGYFPNYQLLESYLKTPVVYSLDVKDPKLMYTAINFLGTRNDIQNYGVDKTKYFKDFGVIEVNFENEEQARLITNGVFNKYYKERISGDNIIDNFSWKKDSINFFAPELMSKYNPEQLASFKDNFYIGGYPGSPYRNLLFSINQKFKLVSNLNRSIPEENIFKLKDQNIFLAPTHSKLTYFGNNYYNGQPYYRYNLLNSRRQIIPGHADITAIENFSDSYKVFWDGHFLSSWGYNYLIDNTFLSQGSSGSMVLDQNGNLLGLYRMYNPGFNYGFIEPIRGSQVIDKNGKIILPGFDLIAGDGQNVSSYRTQLKKYFPNVNTYLKKLKGWN